MNLAPFNHIKPPAMPSGCVCFFVAPFCCWLCERLIGVGVTWLERFHGIVRQLGLFHMKMMQTLFAPFALSLIEEGISVCCLKPSRA